MTTGRTVVRAVLAVAIANLALSAGVTPLPAAAQPTVSSKTPYAVLQGRWVRPDGGYVIMVRSVDAAGRLDAAYANPDPLPFSLAVASRDGRTIRLFFELRAGGYNGSTYALTYDAGSDELRGVYFQAVAQQKYDVRFVRAR